ncbi:MAG: hypothetical protein FWF08_07850 [Oscillospiraceae bacterium]|nr:hypothetical protein [Oscillospiraceae bacterium]
MRKKNTYALDSTALIIPCVSTKRREAPVFRLTAALTEEISPHLLKQAVRDIVPRFPVLYSRLKKGFIWQSLVGASDFDIVEKDESSPCCGFDLDSKEKPLLRVLFKNNEISVELSHLTSDGYGGLIYLNTLAARYLELKGHATEKNRFVFDYLDKPAESEMNDYFHNVYNERKGAAGKQGLASPAFQYKDKSARGYRQSTRVFIPVDAVKALLKRKYGGCSVTEYLTAVYSFSFLKLYEEGKKKKPVKIGVAGNLRSFWDTDTLRNFSGCLLGINVVPDKGGYVFDDVLDLVRRGMSEEYTKEKMEAFICSSVRYLKLLNVIPFFLKKFVICVLNPFAKPMAPSTALLSNLGYIDLPPSFARFIEYYSFITCTVEPDKMKCAAVGVNNVISVTYFPSGKSTAILDFCVDFFKKDGLPVTVDAAAPGSGVAETETRKGEPLGV